VRPKLTPDRSDVSTMLKSPSKTLLSKIKWTFDYSIIA
jgi:hypothetical protein